MTEPNPQHSSTQQMLLLLLSTSTQPVSLSQIMQSVTGHPIVLDRALRALVKDGSITRTKVGRVAYYAAGHEGGAQ